MRPLRRARPRMNSVADWHAPTTLVPTLSARRPTVGLGRGTSGRCTIHCRCRSRNTTGGAPSMPANVLRRWPNSRRRGLTRRPAGPSMRSYPVVRLVISTTTIRRPGCMATCGAGTSCGRLRGLCSSTPRRTAVTGKPIWRCWRLFGCPYLDAVIDGYQQQRPLRDGWRERVGLHQLYPLLAHVVLFGGGYARQAHAAAANALRAG